MMQVKTPRWKSELWSYLNGVNGVHCPAYESCPTRLRGSRCVSDQAISDSTRAFFDDDDPDFSTLENREFKNSRCEIVRKLWAPTKKLADKYLEKAKIDCPPVPIDLITQADDNLPIEVRLLPLKAYHGAVWRLSDCWLIHLNSNDSKARQRFTLYHEIFHVMADCNANLMFKKIRRHPGGALNELLSDFFAARILLPGELVKAKWAEIKDINRMAAIFDVPRPVMYFCLKKLYLI